MRKQLLLAKKIETAKTLATSFNSDAIDVNTADNVGFFIYTDSVTDNTGNFQVQIRPYKDSTSSGAWIDLGSASTLADADNSFFVVNRQLPNCQLRIAYTAAGGTPDGTCDIWVSATGN